MGVLENLCSGVSIFLIIGFYILRSYLNTEINTIFSDEIASILQLSGILSNLFTFYANAKSQKQNNSLKNISVGVGSLFTLFLLFALLQSMVYDLKRFLTSCNNLDFINWAENTQSQADFDRDSDYEGMAAFSGSKNVDSCKSWFVLGSIIYLTLMTLLLVSCVKIWVGFSSLQRAKPGADWDDDGDEKDFDDLDF